MQQTINENGSKAAAVDFESFFKLGSGNQLPYPYQIQLAKQAWRETLAIPTGFGKTSAVLAAWLWKRAIGDAETPRRLIYCLPMRTLVEQTKKTAENWIYAAQHMLGLKNIELDMMMGGRGKERRNLPDWMLYPDRSAILIGTQDLLVSAALMRGYGISRYRWSVDFALLHNDAMWIFDEVQLTGAALATSAQLEAFRRNFNQNSKEHPSRTLWMSATLDPSWLKTVDFSPKDTFRPNDLSAKDIEQAIQLWTARKRLEPFTISGHDLTKKDGIKSYAAALAREARDHTKPSTNTIVFLNTVVRAQAVFEALKKFSDGPEALLIHSRFRAKERKEQLTRLCEKPASEGRIVVTTQALEAGVDVSSAVMITEIAPWSSLVQRFGRCNRFGEYNETGADIFWIDLRDEERLPYETTDLAEARKKLLTLSACGPADLENIPLSAPTRGHVIRKRDLLDLFDTEPDLSGFDVDISLYVRDAEDTDVRFFWRDVAADNAPPKDTPSPQRQELCPAPIGHAKEFVKRVDGRAWRWDPLASKWQSIKKEKEVFPGIVILIDANLGGYDSKRGFDPTSKTRVDPVSSDSTSDSSIGEDQDTLFTNDVTVTLEKHSADARNQAEELADLLGLSENDRAIIVEAALWHDLGKAHNAWTMRMGGTPMLAKSPHFNYKPKGAEKETRPYFRHELASALAYLANKDWSEEHNLQAYLIAAHHGKVRMRLRALPKETQPDDKQRLFARGVWNGDILPKAQLGEITVPETTLDLDLMQMGDSPSGRSSWSARTQRLLQKHGPFKLAWLEALVRIADWRASEAEEKNGK